MPEELLELQLQEAGEPWSRLFLEEVRAPLALREEEVSKEPPGELSQDEWSLPEEAEPQVWEFQKQELLRQAALRSRIHREPCEEDLEAD